MHTVYAKKDFRIASIEEIKKFNDKLNTLFRNNRNIKHGYSRL